MIASSTIGGLEAGFPRCAKCQTIMQVGAARCYFCGTSASVPAPASQPAAAPALAVSAGPARALTVSAGRAPADFVGGLLAGVGIVLVPLALRLVVG
jgi:hypothetical protein